MADLNAVQERLSFFFSRAGQVSLSLCECVLLPLSPFPFPPLAALALQKELARPARSCVLGLLPPRSYWPGPRRRLPLTTTHSSCLCIPHLPPPSAPLRSVGTRGKRGSSFPPGGCMKHQERRKGGKAGGRGAAICIFIFKEPIRRGRAGEGAAIKYAVPDRSETLKSAHVKVVCAVS